MGNLDPEDPSLARIHQSRLIKRTIDQLLGICEFALSDGHIDQNEAESILSWLDNHPECLDTWPVNVLYDTLNEILHDGILDQDEQKKLLGLILQISQPRDEHGHHVPTSLPLNDPPPDVAITGKSFCFTGIFNYGSRADCESAITQRGGTTAKGVTKKLDYLVIGNIGSEAWSHSSFGSKIAKAVDYRENGVPIAIISEAHWRNFLS